MLTNDLQSPDRKRNSISDCGRGGVNIEVAQPTVPPMGSEQVIAQVLASKGLTARGIIGMPRGLAAIGQALEEAEMLNALTITRPC